MQGAPTRSGSESLRALIAPRSIAVLGASDRPSGALSLIHSLQRLGFPGQIHPVNPRHASVAGLTCYPTITDVPEAPDVVACCIGGERIVASLPAVAARGALAAVIYDGGFAERDEDGRRAQDTITGICREAGMALCGPNGMGILNPLARSTTYLSELRDPTRLAGNVGLISQSGSICNGMLADLRRFGFSLVVSCGNEAVTGTAAYLEYLIDDPGTRVIATFTETIREPERYVAALDRAAAVGKPVVVLKVGRSDRTRRAIHSHTGGLAGEAHVFSEVLRAHRAIEVRDLDEMTEVLAACQGARWPRGPRVGLTTGSGGQVELILDLAAPMGLDLPPLSPADRAEAERVIGSITGDGNPLDYWGNGDFRTNLPHALSVLGAGDAHDAIVYCVDAHDDQPMATPERLLEYAGALVQAARQSDKPHYLMNMRPGVMNQAQIALLRQDGISVIGGTRQGLAAIDRLGHYALAPAPFRDHARLAVQGLDGDGRTINEFDAKRLLAAHGLPVAREHLVATAAQASAAAAEIGYPVVLKAVADAIPHKTELGLVVLGIDGDATLGHAWEQLGQRVDAAGVRESLRGFLVQEFVRDGVEVFAGIVRDPDFGLFLAFGAGGTDIETKRDFALRSLPLREGDAEAMIAATGAGALLGPRRGKSGADLARLTDCLYSLAAYAEAGGALIAEIDLNPIKVLPEGQSCIIVDALIVTTTTARGPAQ
jgi:acyl-CoA synthetase (NDP forming)